MKNHEKALAFIPRYLAAHPGASFEEVRAAVEAEGIEFTFIAMGALQAHLGLGLRSSALPDDSQGWSMEFGYQWQFDGRRREMVDVRRELEESAAWIRANSGREFADDLMSLDGIAVPFAELLLRYQGVPEGAEEYEDCELRLQSRSGEGFSLVEFLTAIHNATIENMRDANHRYPEGFYEVGRDEESGLPIVEMSCGS